MTAREFILHKEAWAYLAAALIIWLIGSQLLKSTSKARIYKIVLAAGLIIPGALAWPWYSSLVFERREKLLAYIAEHKRLDCLDKFCEGDIRPSHDNSHEETLKFNGRWFVGPDEYFSSGVNGATFWWWQKKSYSRRMELPSDAKPFLKVGSGYDATIEIFLRSTNIPPAPLGYDLIQLANERGWIAQREEVRPGLERITMKHVVGPSGYYLDDVTYYIATREIGLDGLPPVAACSHDDPRNRGGTGVMWQDGIWVGAAWNQQHCADWPEIHQEIVRIISLLRSA
jgi:hypothetical protein